MLVPFPASYDYRAVQSRLVGRASTGGVALSGAITRVASNAAHWQATVSFVLHGEQAFLEWQQFAAQMQGGIGETLVPLWPRIRPKDRDGQELPRDDFTRLGQVQIEVPQEVHVRTRGDADIGDTIIGATYPNTTGVFPGHTVQIGNHAYVVVNSYLDQNDVQRLQIDPPLREAIPLGSTVVVDRPKCLMTVDSGQDISLPHTLSPVEIITVNFIEAQNGQ